MRLAAGSDVLIAYAHGMLGVHVWIVRRPADSFALSWVNKDAGGSAREEQQPFVSVENAWARTRLELPILLEPPGQS